MKILITGIAGFAGSHLAEFALREGAEVVGTILPGTPTDNLARVQRDVATVDCDLTEPGAAGQVLAATRPDRVFHLAGAAVVGTSWALRADVLRTNLEATYQLCEGLRRHPVPCLIVSSGEVYGVVPRTSNPSPKPDGGRRARRTPCRRPPRSSTPGTTRAPRACRW